MENTQIIIKMSPSNNTATSIKVWKKQEKEKLKKLNKAFS
jgi:hypothetical protein